jgi:glycosyltransferase involved in cell wall biosynthesis
LYDKVSFKFSFKLYDAVLVITNHLEQEITGRVRRGVPLLNVPMTVETARFLNSGSRKPEQSDYIAYCGDVRGNKDGVADLINAFALISKKYQNLKLYIIGDAPGSDALQRLKELSNKLGLDGAIVFTGRVLRDDMPMYLCHARILALARPTSLQADYGFPSKLGEYLATGNPVVVTRVGEIPLYLEDGKNAFITEPDNIGQFASKLEYVLEHPDIAREVGLRGRVVALDHFDYKLQGERIVKFLTQRASQR